MSISNFQKLTAKNKVIDQETCAPSSVANLALLSLWVTWFPRIGIFIASAKSASYILIKKNQMMNLKGESNNTVCVQESQMTILTIKIDIADMIVATLMGAVFTLSLLRCIYLDFLQIYSEYTSNIIIKPFI